MLPNGIDSVIDTQSKNGTTTVLYKGKLKSNSNLEGLGVAFFRGNKKDGWQKIAHYGLEYTDSKDIKLYYRTLPNASPHIYTVYGSVNPEVSSLEAKNYQDSHFNKVKMTKRQGNIYFLIVGKVETIRALSENGKIIKQENVY